MPDASINVDVDGSDADRVVFDADGSDADPAVIDADGDDADRALVELERAELRTFVEQLSLDDIKSGGWFTQLLATAP
jgi:hypothetical protein